MKINDVDEPATESDLILNHELDGFRTETGSILNIDCGGWDGWLLSAAS